ncbi:MAG: DUF3570 domain-containing protein [Burkholderiales bacterium]
MPAGALLAAALALPGVMPSNAHAQAAPDKGIVELQYLNYRDWQPGADRMTVQAPSFYALVPINDTTVIEGGMVYDQMSGASPKFFNTLSGATIGDFRTAGDLKVTKYFPGYAVSFGGYVSSEQDFLSRGGSVTVQVFSEDRNRTWSLGFSGTNDRINSDNGIAVNEKRNSLEFLVGVTQALSANSIVQSNLTYYTGHGYYSDPYKSLDTRPTTRQIWAWLTRYNQYFPDPDGTLKLGYRLLSDSFGTTSNMFEVAWVQSLPYGFTVTPGLRYATQSAADFYFNPPWPKGYGGEGTLYSADTRLAAWGAITAGVIVGKTLWEDWSISLRADYYRQDPDWRLGGSGSPGIKTFTARWFQVDLTKTF